MEPCRTCIYWVKDPPNNEGKSIEGTCRAESPMAIGANNRAIWPITLCDDGCGDHSLNNVVKKVGAF